MRKFFLFGKMIEIGIDVENSRDIIVMFVNLASNAELEFEEYYKKNYRNLDDFSRDCLRLGNEIILKNIEFCIDYLINEGIYDINKELFFLEYYAKNSYNFDEYFFEINDKYMEIILKEEQKSEYRKYRKEYRGKWVGGGFGVRGAIKGAMTASAMNIVTGFIHDVFNIGEEIVSDLIADGKKEKIFNDFNTLNSLKKGIFENVSNIANALIYYLEKNNVKPIRLITDDLVKKNKIILDNIKEKKIPNNKILELLISAIETNPYETMIYTLLVDNYGDRKREVELIASYFGIDILEYKMSIIKKYDDYTEINSKEVACKLKDELVEKCTLLGINEYNNEIIDSLEMLILLFDEDEKTFMEITSESEKDADIYKDEYFLLQNIFNESEKKTLSSINKQIIEINSLDLKTNLRLEYIKKLEIERDEIYKNRLKILDEYKPMIIDMLKRNKAKLLEFEDNVNCLDISDDVKLYILSIINEMKDERYD